MEPGPLTRRQQVAALLRERDWGFEELRHELQMTVRLLADDLRHIERSARGAGARLAVEPACCAACGFEFRNRVPRHFHVPARCPKCRSERIREPRFRIEEAGNPVPR